jgi:hypothetical protein
MELACRMFIAIFERQRLPMADELEADGKKIAQKFFNGWKIDNEYNRDRKYA